jgi:hypothetical protein
MRPKNIIFKTGALDAIDESPTPLLRAPNFTHQIN